MVTGFSKPETIGRNSYTYDDAKYYYGADGKRVNYIGWQELMESGIISTPILKH